MKHPISTSIFRPILTGLMAATGLVVSLFVPGAADAASSQWARSEGGDIRIVAAPPLADGTIPAILEIRLQPGWKTYWLEPGASGIPPQVTIDPLSGIQFAGLRFPAPKTFDDGVVRYTGYDRPVSLPMQLRQTAPGKTVDLKASVFLGICKDICIPVQAELALSLPAGTAANPLEKARIDDATSALPQAPSKDFRVAGTQIDAGQKSVRIDIVAPGERDAAPDLFIAGPAGFSFGKARISAATDGAFTVDIDFRAPAKHGDLKGKTALLVVRSGGRTMETPLAFD